MKSHNVGMQIGGIIGILAMAANSWIGGAIVLVGAIIVAISVRTPKPKITHQMKIEVPEHNQQTMTEFLSKPVIPDHKTLSLLKRTLYQSNLDPRAPVVVGEENKTLLSVQEVLVEMITIADAHGLPVSELAGDITKIYPKIFDNTEAAVREYPHDLVLLAYWLANRSLKDVRTELDTQGANIRKSMAD